LGGADGEAAGLQGVVVDGGLLGEAETGELHAPEEAERLLRLTAVELVGEAVEDLGQRRAWWPVPRTGRESTWPRLWSRART
jgi:hypothetical protein